MPPPKKHQTAQAATDRTEPVALVPEPSREVAAPLAVRETAEKPSAPAFDPTTDTSTSYSRLVQWYTSGAEGGRRSFLATARHYGVDESTVRDQAKKGRWLERAAAFDRQLLAKELSAGLGVQRRGVVAQAALAERLTSLIERAVSKLESIEDDDESGAMDIIEPALEACKGLQRAQAALRVCLNMPTSTAQVNVSVTGFGGEASDKLDYGRLPEEHASVCMRVLQAADALNTIMRGTDADQLHAEDTRALVGVVASLAPSVDGETFVERHARVRSDFGLGDGHG